MNPASDFKIVLLHEDLVSGLRGTSVVERLAGRLEMESAQLDPDIWKFSVLREPGLRAEAITLLRQAKLIIISAGGRTDLPGHIREIIEQALWLRSDEDGAIVALLDSGPTLNRELPRTGIYLRNLAAKMGLDFFCNTDEWQPQVETVHDFSPFQVQGASARSNVASVGFTLSIEPETT